MKMILRWFFVFASLTLLYGCGSGASTNSGVSGPTTVAAKNAVDGQVVMAPAYSSTVRFLDANGKAIMFQNFTTLANGNVIKFDNMSTVKTDESGRFKIRVVGASRIMATGGVYSDPTTGAITPCPVLMAPGDAKNVTALTTLVAQADDPAAIKARIEAMGGKYDDSLATMTTSNQKSVLLAEGVGAAIKEIQAAAGTANLATAMNDFANQMKVQLQASGIDMTKAADLQTATQAAAKNISIVKNSPDSAAITAAINNQVSSYIQAMGQITPGLAGYSLPTVSAATLTNASQTIKDAMNGNMVAVINAASTTQQAVIAAAMAATPAGGDISKAIVAAQSAAQAVAQAAMTSATTIDMASAINKATAAAMTAATGQSILQIASAAQAAAMTMANGVSSDSQLAAAAQSAAAATTASTMTMAQANQAAQAVAQVMINAATNGLTSDQATQAAQAAAGQAASTTTPMELQPLK